MLKYCSHCMAQIEGTETECPVCGKPISIQVPAHHLLPGTILAKKFYVGKALGEGGFGITYIGRDINLDMKIAIKEYYPNGYVNRSNTVSPQVNDSVTEGRKDFFEKGRERFLREARILARFSGEAGVVDVRDFFEENNTAYIIMEYLEGQDLKNYLNQNGTLTPDQTVRLLMPVMHSLKKIHEQGLIHRDISPDNIMLVGDKVKLLDFGAARSVSAAANKSLSVMLKPGYAPEEQYRSKGSQGPWTDVYALCATMYKCITGVTPDDATQRVFSDEVKTPSALGISISPEIEKAIMRGMSVQQKDRYQNIDDLIRGLQGIEVELEGTDRTQTVSAGRKVQEDDVETRYVAGAREKGTSGRAVSTGKKALEGSGSAGEKGTSGGTESTGKEAPEGSESTGEKGTSGGTESTGKKASEGSGSAGEKETSGGTEGGPEKVRKAADASKKKSGKLLTGVIAGAVVALTALVTVVVMLLPKDSDVPEDISPAFSEEELALTGFVMKNDRSIELIEPETPLDPKEIYSGLTYSERMFYGSYTLAPSAEDDLELSRYQEAMDYGILTNESGKYLTNIPYSIEAGPGTLSHAICDIKDHSWMRLHFYTEDGYMNYILAAYEVEGKVLRVRPVSELNVDNTENPYTLADTVIEYGFEFSGPNLTLTLDGKSVKLRAEGFDKEIVGASYRKEYSLYTDAAVSAGSPQIPGVTRFRFRFTLSDTASSSYFYFFDEEGTQLNEGTGRLTEEGLFTFSGTDGHVQNTQYYTGQYVYFYCHNDGLVLTDGETIYYYQGEEQPAEEAPGEEGTEDGAAEGADSSQEESEEVVMSDELFDFTFELDGDVYRLPCSYSCFTERGWTIATSGYNGDKLIGGKKYDSFYIARDGHQVRIYSYNMSGNAKSINDCKVGGIMLEADKEMSASIARGITPSSTAEEVKEAFGTPDEDNIVGDGEEIMTYRLGGSESKSVMFSCVEDNTSVYSQPAYIKITNYVSGEEDYTETNEKRPNYLSEYVSPDSLEEDIYSGVLSLDGDLYRMPIPVSSLIDNGWIITQQPGSVVSGGTESVRAEREGKKLYFDVINLAKYQTSVENCVVCKVELSSNTEIEAAFSTGEEPVALGMTKEALDAVIPEDFTRSEGSFGYGYKYSEYMERIFGMSISVDKETGVVSNITVECKTWPF